MPGPGRQFSAVSQTVPPLVAAFCPRLGFFPGWSADLTPCRLNLGAAFTKISFPQERQGSTLDSAYFPQNSQDFFHMTVQKLLKTKRLAHSISSPVEKRAVIQSFPALFHSACSPGSQLSQGFSTVFTASKKKKSLFLIKNSIGQR
jgi:hypothetical protein